MRAAARSSARRDKRTLLSSSAAPGDSPLDQQPQRPIQPAPGAAALEAARDATAAVAPRLARAHDPTAPAAPQAGSFGQVRGILRPSTDRRRTEMKQAQGIADVFDAHVAAEFVDL